MAARLRVGFIPFDAPEKAAAADDFAREVGRALNTPIEVHRAADYRGLVAALSHGMVQVAWVPPLIAAKSVIARDIRPVAVAVRNGSTTYSAALIVHREATITSAREIRGARAAWVDRESASGYTVIRLALRAQGVSLVDAFKHETFARSHAEVARLVASQRVDVGATYLNYLPDGHTLVRAGWMGVPGIDPACVRVLTSAGPIPCDFVGVHRTLPAPIVEGFTSALVDGRHGPRLNHAAKRLMGADGFVRSSPEHLELLVELMRQLDPPRPPSSRP